MHFLWVISLRSSTQDSAGHFTFATAAACEPPLLFMRTNVSACTYVCTSTVGNFDFNLHNKMPVNKTCKCIMYVGIMLKK